MSQSVSSSRHNRVASNSCPAPKEGRVTRCNGNGAPDGSQPLRNPRHESFAKLVALGNLSLTECFVRVGYAEKHAASHSIKLAEDRHVQPRIKYLRTREDNFIEMSRHELQDFLASVVREVKQKLSQARLSDGLKAAEMYAKMCGFNEPERVNVQSIEFKVDSALIEQLRGGYHELAQGRAKLHDACVKHALDGKGAPPPGTHPATPAPGYIIDTATPSPGKEDTIYSHSGSEIIIPQPLPETPLPGTSKTT